MEKSTDIMVDANGNLIIQIDTQPTTIFCPVYGLGVIEYNGDTLDVCIPVIFFMVQDIQLSKN